MKKMPTFPGTEPNRPVSADGPGVACAHAKLVPTAELRPNPGNPNTHSKAQLDLYARILRHQGWRKAITVSKQSGLIVTGHGAWLTAKAEAFKNRADEVAHMIADNKLPQLAEIDEDALAKAISEDLKGPFDLSLTGLSLDELQDLELIPGTPDDTPLDLSTNNLNRLQKKWKTATGQLWQFGEHRLLCGDSTKADHVQKLIKKDRPVLMVTDPPYGVNYDANWRNEAARTSKGMGNRCLGAGAIGKVNNDHRSDWSEAWKLFDGDVAYVWHAGVMASKVEGSLLAAEFVIRSQIVWAKSNFAIGRGDYHWQHEPCWYAVRKGGKSHWSGDRSQATLWQIDKPQKSETGHSTQKPIECMARPIQNNSKAGDLVYDPFLGSGTTLIACENLKRGCRGIEIAPEYVAVTLQRWCDLTGNRPKLS